MQTLVFNTKTKTVTVYEGKEQNSTILYSFTEVPTVKIVDGRGFYEVMKKVMNNNLETRVPVARFPISNTNMLIEN
jgi:hypothetical protein